MNDATVLVRAYYEILHEILQTRRQVLVAKVDEHLKREIETRDFEALDADGLAAYREACLAFIEERLETYNPIGIQYTFEHIDSPTARELELQLDWYDSRQEFQSLLTCARALIRRMPADHPVWDLARELVIQSGAFPDRSIIAAYEASPALWKLPDYAVARAIEGLLNRL